MEGWKEGWKEGSKYMKRGETLNAYYLEKIQSEKVKCHDFKYIAFWKRQNYGFCDSVFAGGWGDE
jgi:hypothetical protein